ncbi:hypothetical protein QW060_25520 [Myroides ceti]|uniref:Uncharacterized protein n=1 Tax=Paenimyroides ceti TaxID=395087 RepID=A0ABT8D4E5_9FLAO|nr:hypothetical protein [Paenimyroides ceti]MDN3710227.1 hypothetical protein [Paenimyroides ceti]
MDKEYHITEEVITALQQIVSPSFVFSDVDVLKQYGSDHTEDLNFPPSVVVKPQTTVEVSEIMKLASEYRIPVVPIEQEPVGSGGLLAVPKGIGLSLERRTALLLLMKKFSDHKTTRRHYRSLAK